LLRDGKTVKVIANIGESTTAAAPAGGLSDAPSPEENQPPHPALEGAQLADAANNGGVVVRNVAAGSRAASIGLRGGDVIVRANRSVIGKLTQLREATRNVPVVVLGIRRGNELLLFTLR
jgi:S1-C subfamily serine protease